jgi:hypothetical protein
MIYSADAPYEILENRLIDFGTMQRMRRFARYWDLVSNSGNFVETAPLLWQVAKSSNPDGATGTPVDAVNDASATTTAIAGGGTRHPQSPFAAFMRFSDWLFATTGRRHGIALDRLAELLFTFLTVEPRHTPAAVAQALWRDYQRCGRTEKPVFLAALLPGEARRRAKQTRVTGMKRQTRHRAGGVGVAQEVRK